MTKYKPPLCLMDCFNCVYRDCIYDGPPTRAEGAMYACAKAEPCLAELAERGLMSGPRAQRRRDHYRRNREKILARRLAKRMAEKEGKMDKDGKGLRWEDEAAALPFWAEAVLGLLFMLGLILLPIN